jgi:HSP20 family protein
MAPSLSPFSKVGNRVIRVDLPGVEPNDMEVSVASHVLTIRASREGHNNELINEGELHEVSYGRFERSLTLPEGVQSDQIKAHYQNGVLELTMPEPAEPAGLKIPIGIDSEEKQLKQLLR